MALLDDSEQRVFVGSLSGKLRPNQPELRLDSCNGMNKFVWLSKGNGRVMINCVTKSVGPHTLIYVPENTPHRMELSNGTFGTVVACESIINAALPEEPFLLPILNLMDQKQIATRFDRLLAESNVKGVGQNTAAECLVGLLSVQAARMAVKAQSGQKQTAAQRLMKTFAEILERDYRTGRTLTDYATEMGVTPTHLTRVSRQMNAKSASRIIQERVLSEARNLLVDTNHKILEISDQLGFSSPAYFTRLFSMKLGQTPKEFRQSETRH